MARAVGVQVVPKEERDRAAPPVVRMDTLLPAIPVLETGE